MFRLTAAVRCSLSLALLPSTGPCFGPRARLNLNGPSSQVFDPFWFGYTRLGHFRKTGSVRGRASTCKSFFCSLCAAPGVRCCSQGFWLECVEDLRNSLETRGAGGTKLYFGKWHVSPWPRRMSQARALMASPFLDMNPIAEPRFPDLAEDSTSS